jgi:uncharacterized SAM-binding protein YcdF (DUF218 family)
MKRLAFKFIIGICIVITIAGICILARKPLLRLVSDQLIQEDTLISCDRIVVLSGYAEERAPEAARLLSLRKSASIVVTGAVTPRIFREMGIQLTEADLSAYVLKKSGVDSGRIEFLRKGTSTWEECKALADYANQHDYKSVILVSSLFHTQRMQWVANRTLRKNGIQVIIRGAPPIAFNKDEWWESEDGLLFVVNEYLKLLYYLYKYSD